MMRHPFLILCATGLFAIFSSTLSKSPVLPLFAQSLGADPAQTGFAAAISAFAGVIFSVPAGLLSDRLGRKRMLLVSACIFAGAPFLYLPVTRIWQLCIVRFIHGFSTAIFVPVAMALVSELFHRERGEKMGWFSTSTLLGRFLAPLAGGALIAIAPQAQTGFFSVYLVCGAAGIAALAFALAVPAPTQAQVPRSWPDALAGFREIAADRRVLLTCSVEAAILFAYGTFETFLPLHAVQSGQSPAAIGICLSSQVIALALTKPVMGKFSDRHGRRPQILAGGLAAALCVSGFGLFASFLPFLVLSIAFGLSLSIVTSATSAYVADLSSERARGSAMGMLGSIMDIGHTAGPIVSGLAAAQFGYSTAFIGAAAVVLLISAAFLSKVGLSDRKASAVT